MKNSLFMVFALFCFASLHASELAVEKKEPNHDLRGEKILFSWGSSKDGIVLKVSLNSEYRLIVSNHEKKITSIEADSLEKKITDEFISAKYGASIEASQPCPDKSVISLHGDQLEYCKSDVKASSLEVFYKEIKNKYK